MRVTDSQMSRSRKSPTVLSAGKCAFSRGRASVRAENAELEVWAAAQPKSPARRTFRMSPALPEREKHPSRSARGRGGADFDRTVARIAPGESATPRRFFQPHRKRIGCHWRQLWAASASFARSHWRARAPASGTQSTKILHGVRESDKRAETQHGVPRSPPRSSAGYAAFLPPRSAAV